LDRRTLNAGMSAQMKRPGAPAPRTGCHHGVTWELLAPQEVLRCPSTLGRWHELLREHSPNQRLYQTPEWFAHVEQNCAPWERGALAVARAGGSVCGIAPLRVGRDSLQFRAAGRTLYRSSLMKVSVLGGQPLLPESRSLYDGLFAALHAGFPECDGVSLCE